MTNSSRRNLIMLMISLDRRGKIDGRGLGGMIRLQKLLYLFETEASKIEDGFDFFPYKTGPCSSKLYDDLEFLENLSFLKGEVVAEATEEEAIEIDLLSFENLLGDGAETDDGKPVDGFGAADAYEERRFSLTEEGLETVKKLLARDDYAATVQCVRKIKAKYGHHSLNDLLRYVYTNYPGMTVA